MARSAAERLELYYEWRDDLETALQARTGNRQQEVTIRGRTYIWADAIKELETVLSRIGNLESQLAAVSGQGAATNRVTLKK